MVARLIIACIGMVVSGQIFFAYTWGWSLDAGDVIAGGPRPGIKTSNEGIWMTVTGRVLGPMSPPLPGAQPDTHWTILLGAEADEPVTDPSVRADRWPRIMVVKVPVREAPLWGDVVTFTGRLLHFNTSHMPAPGHFNDGLKAARVRMPNPFALDTGAGRWTARGVVPFLLLAWSLWHAYLAFARRRHTRTELAEEPGQISAPDETEAE